MFRTSTVPASQPALYQLSIRAPGQQFAELSTYTFPITPSSIRYTPSAMSSRHDTRGPPTSQGVTRVVDRYGLTPPDIVIEGTTGWDRHLSDGYILTGLQSIQLLQKFLQQYETLNQQQLAAGIPNLYTLEFYDYFQSQFWQVEPMGPQTVRQSSDRPLLTYYRFFWMCVAPVGLPILGEIDAIANTLLTPAAQAAINAARTLGAVLVAYGPTGIVSSLI
jgi:hypothetical protein